MQKVRFLQDFQGKETREVFYKQGQEVELDESLVDALLKDGRVELVKEVYQPAKHLLFTKERVEDDVISGSAFQSEVVLDKNQEWVEPESQKRKRGKK